MEKKKQKKRKDSAALRYAVYLGERRSLTWKWSIKDWKTLFPSLTFFDKMLQLDPDVLEEDKFLVLALKYQVQQDEEEDEDLGLDCWEGYFDSGCEAALKMKAACSKREWRQFKKFMHAVCGERGSD